MSDTINGVIKTKLTTEEIALLAVAVGYYLDAIKDCKDEELKRKYRHIIDRLGREMGSYPKNDFTK